MTTPHLIDSELDIITDLQFTSGLQLGLTCRGGPAVASPDCATTKLGRPQRVAST
jgi:hypothetical protein